MENVGKRVRYEVDEVWGWGEVEWELPGRAGIGSMEGEWNVIDQFLFDFFERSTVMNGGRWRFFYYARCGFDKSIMTCWEEWGGGMDA
jgi:hypothetical protein